MTSGVQVEKEQFLLNLHTGRSLTENTIPVVVLIQFDLMMSTQLLETCKFEDYNYKRII